MQNMRASQGDDGTHNGRLPCHEEPLSWRLEPPYDEHQREKSPRKMATVLGQIKLPDFGQKRRRLDIHHAIKFLIQLLYQELNKKLHLLRTGNFI